MSTQPITQVDGCSDGEEDDAESSDESVWGRLVNSSVPATHDFHVLDVAGDGDLDVHTIGRNHRCSIVVDDNRVSGYHCRIYRRWVQTPILRTGVLKVYVEDTSSNGTFLNKVKLGKRERRELENGDEVALVSARRDATRRTAFSFIKVDVNMRHASVMYSENNHENGRSLTVCASDTARRVEADYDIREEIGRGAIGRVYQAIERSTGIAWAIKVIQVYPSSVQSVPVDSLLHEARVLRQLSHPYIVKVKDVYCNEAAFYIVMQLVEGGDLFDRILKRRVYTEVNAKGVIGSLLSALAYLHDRSIAHRDIKPENILLRSTSSDVDVLLTDFGLAKVSEAGSNRYNTICGTPQYLAPEVMHQAVNENTGYDGTAADIWSVGVVMFVLLSGTQPYHSDWLFDAAWSRVSLEAKDVIRQMTIVNADLRPSATSLARAPWLMLGKSLR